MADTAVVLNISEMINQSIGTPEVGVVDFNMVQAVLYCLAQQLHILGKNVELRGNAFVVAPIKESTEQTMYVREYFIDAEYKGPAREAEVLPTPSAAETETILVVEKRKKSDVPVERRQKSDTPAPASSRPKQDKPPATKITKSTSQAPAHVSSSDKLSLVTLSKFNILEKSVEDIQNRVYGSIPKNEDILEEVRSQTNVKAIQEMWTSFNVSSRLEAAEEGIAKLSSLVEDLIGESTELQDAAQRRSSKKQEALPPPSATATQPLSTVVIPPATPGQAVLANKAEIEAMQSRLNQMRADLDGLTKTFNSALAEIHSAPSATNTATPGQAGAQPATAGEAGAPSLGVAASTFESPSLGAPSLGVAASTFASPSLAADKSRRMSALSAGLAERVNELEKRLKICCDTIGKKDGVIQDQINSFQDQLEYLMKQVGQMSEELASGKLSPDLIKDLQGLMQLFQTVQDMQQQLSRVHETALQLAAEKEDRQTHMNALLEQIELLKTVKLDREDMVEAMADKADLRMLARKVSHDQFELACDDLSRGLEHALGKLNLQEALWQQALDDIQREIETKLDKMELSPVKEFFNSKLKQLQDNLKQMASLRKEAEAAGTKRKLLRDVNCISCDANAVMPMEASSVPVAKPMPASLSMKPYLSYELDAIRKSQQSNLPGRNMHDWETIDKQMTQPKKPQKVRSETNKHLCNRYCGGSHTTTTAAQRVARLGHFMKQWGPDVVPLTSGLATGDDGRMYRVSPAVEVAVGPGGAVDSTCTTKPPGMPDTAKPAAHRPITISAECRCLEGERPPRMG